MAQPQVKTKVKVMVTGGLGFVGGRVIQHLHAAHPEFNLIIVDRRLPSTDERQSEFQYGVADLRLLEPAQAVVQQFRPDVVVHCAGISPELRERYLRRIEKEVFRINLDATRNMVEASRSAGVQAFVQTSSCCAVTDDFSRPYANIDERWPLVEPGHGTMYGESKAQAETIVLQADSPEFRTCALRPAVIFGEGDYQLVPNIVHCIISKDESPYRLGDGLNMWDTVYVGNVADAHVLAVENLLSSNPTAAGEAFFIQNNEPHSSRDFMLQIWKEYNGHMPPFEVGIPVSMAWLVGVVCEVYAWLTGTPTTISRGSVADATAMRYASGLKAERVLGYVPRVGVEAGLRQSIQWLVKKHEAEGLVGRSVNGKIR